MSTSALVSGECVWCGAGGPYGRSEGRKEDGHHVWCPPNVEGGRRIPKWCKATATTGRPRYTLWRCQLGYGHEGEHEQGGHRW